MHYYNFHIGDYKSHTYHLTAIEDLAYRRLLDLYYMSEKPIISDDAARIIGMREHGQDVLHVLLEFWEETPDGFINKRADAEIAGYYAKLEQASAAGKASAAKRALNGSSTTVQHQFNDRSTDVQPTNNRKPITNNQSITPDGFDEFWSAYPKKVGKGAAESAWKKHKPELSVCLAAIASAKASRDWQKENGQYIPNPATWINQKRWADGVTTQDVPAAVEWVTLPNGTKVTRRTYEIMRG